MLMCSFLRRPPHCRVPREERDGSPLGQAGSIPDIGHEGESECSRTRVHGRLLRAGVLASEDSWSAPGDRQVILNRSYHYGLIPDRLCNNGVIPNHTMMG